MRDVSADQQGCTTTAVVSRAGHAWASTDPVHRTAATPVRRGGGGPAGLLRAEDLHLLLAPARSIDVDRDRERKHTALRGERARYAGGVVAMRTLDPAWAVTHSAIPNEGMQELYESKIALRRWRARLAEQTDSQERAGALNVDGARDLHSALVHNSALFDHAVLEQRANCSRTARTQCVGMLSDVGGWPYTMPDGVATEAADPAYPALGVPVRLRSQDCTSIGVLPGRVALAARVGTPMASNGAAMGACAGWCGGRARCARNSSARAVMIRGEGM
ncbi:hypothetical protein DFH09DRAFT_226994 [Mycena vulgaris]|nr:hypothetical protein DFH09DRAFT_226994 [Mycena vulgaris]